MLEYIYAIFSVLIFGFGAYILTRFGWTIAIIYIGYGLIFEAYIFYKSFGASLKYGKKYSLGSSYYFGKNSRFEKNVLNLKKDPAEELTKKSHANITMLNIIFEVLIVIPPIIAAFHRFLYGFSWFCAGLIIVFILLYFTSKGVIWKISTPSYSTH
jgi:hypothetical protein